MCKNVLQRYKGGAKIQIENYAKIITMQRFFHERKKLSDKKIQIVFNLWIMKNYKIILKWDVMSHQ